MELSKKWEYRGVMLGPRLTGEDAGRTRLNRSEGIAEILDRYGACFLGRDSRNDENSHDQSREAGRVCRAD